MNPYINGRRANYQQIEDDGREEEAQFPQPNYLPDPEPYTNQYSPSYPQGYSQSYGNQPYSQYTNPYGNLSAAAQQAPQVGAQRVTSSSHLMPPVPEHQEFDSVTPEISAGEVPWDANVVQQSSSRNLINDSYADSYSAPRRRRGSSISNSFRRYWGDSEARPGSSNHSQLGRGASFRQFFGMQPETATENEFADDDDYTYDNVPEQIPISGDEYQLNTWNAPEHLHPLPQQPDFPQASNYEQDLGQNPWNENSPQQPYHPFSDEYQQQGDYSDQYGEGYPGEGYQGEGYQDSYQGYADYANSLLGGDNEKAAYGSEEGEEGEDDAISKRVVELFKGNLVLDCPVSPLLLQKYPEHNPVREFTHMRYTAATCDPADFVDEEYTLRQMCYSQPRTTELFICVTIYNEDDILLGRTLQGVFNNIRHLCHRDRSDTWGPEAWKKVVVCVVADGRTKLNPRAKALMASLGAYQEGFAKNMVNNKSVEAHLYEYTSMVRIGNVSEKEGVKLTTERAVPVQLMFCMKEKNQRKINSHRWFFQAFSEVLKPKVCVLLDAGTRPGNHAIYHLWKSFDRDQRVAGACGEIAAMLGTGGCKLINPLVAAQNFEYKMSNILDKPSESMFGFITVLPGAFSAYRYEALQNNPNGTGPLEKYFKGEKLEGKGGVFQANMYLAEDRILCWELVSKRNADWLLRYVKGAKAHTDVPERLSELILQRRRWLNGSFFAQVYSLVHCFSIWRSGHTVLRKLAFHIQFLYQALALTFSWFSLANFFLVFHILAAAVGADSAGFAPGKILSVVLSWIYAACMLIVFILSFGNRPQGTKRVYDMIVVFFALLMCYMLFSTIYITVKAVQYAICANGHTFQAELLWTNNTFRDLIISLLATYALYLLVSLLFMDPWHVFTSMAQYTVLSPAYVNVLNVYAFCNTHDISWGTKGDTEQKLDLGVVKADEKGKLALELPTSTDLVDKYYLDEINVLSTPPEPEKAPIPSDADKKRDYYALFRSSVVVVWVLMNLALIGVVLNIGGFQTLLGGVDGANDSSSSSSSTSSSSSSSSDSNLGVKRSLSVFKRDSSGTCQSIEAGGNSVSKVYMAVIFWSVAVFAAFRFILSVAYLFKYIFRRV